MSEFIIPPANLVYTINCRFEELVTKAGKGGAILVKKRLPDGSLETEVLTASDAERKPQLNAVLAAYEGMKDALLGRKDKSLKPGLVVAFPYAVCPAPEILVERPKMVGDRYMGLETVVSEDNAFLVYQPSSNLVWKPLGTVKIDDEDGEEVSSDTE